LHTSRFLNRIGLPGSQRFFDISSGALRISFDICIVFIVVYLSGCGAQKRFPNFGNVSSQNAVDSVVQPETDMRIKTHRSQEHPGKLNEVESERKGGIANDNSA